MSSQDLVEYYTNIVNCQAIFHFKRFIQKYCLSYTRKPSQLETQIPINFSKAKDLVVENFCLNESFYSKDFYFTDDFCFLCQIFFEKDLNDKNLAQLIFLILISKNQLDFYFYENVLLEINRLEIIDSEPFEYLNQLSDRLKFNETIRKKILNLIKEIVGKSEVNFPFEKLEISFFKYPDLDLHGFAGINRIYIGSMPLFELNKKLAIKSNQDRLLVLKLEFLRLFIHLSIHVILAWLKNDLNFAHAKNHDNKNDLYIDSGVLAENKLFNFQINWFEFEHVDLAIWRFFYQSLIDYEQFVNFNAAESGVKNKKNLKSINGIDYFSF